MFVTRQLIQTQKFEWKEVKAIIWRNQFLKVDRTKIQVAQDKQIIYSKDGAILKIEEIDLIPKKQKAPMNIQQIINLQWLGQYGEQYQKIGRWTAIWMGVNVDIGGFYCEQGKKIGLWKEIIKFHQDQTITYESGEYINNKKVGQWKVIYNGLEIGGGTYNEDNQRHGKWVKVRALIQRNWTITYIGIYKNGKKVGVWDIYFKFQKRDQLIGGGVYDKTGQGCKTGQWIDIADGFQWDSYVIHNGEYKNGKKVGKWETLQKNLGNKLSLKMIGGGSYDEGNQGLKIDQWIDIGHIFQSAQVTYSGEYKQGNKIGRWDSWWKSKYKQNLKIGGGYYDKGGQSDKIGLWVDVSDEFFEESQVIFNGEYKNGKKIGRWGIWLRIQDRLGGNIGRKQMQIINKNILFQSSGGGAYNELGQKIGT
ncbi:unnamed protein product [Paramecium octaurelia]|uniref:Uncharacterized protein n=1 Tax=Paramecium octaurelia TaxID=43137 RepID=A0A8S1URI7_PAROT|nr:unnamed protein product [Paramecium octaurelia]